MKKRLLTLVLLFATSSFANIDFTNISQSDLDGIMEDFAGNMVHSSARGSSSSTIFGFQVGLVASMIDSPHIKDMDSDMDKIGNGGLFAAVDLPLGFGAEAIIAPIEVGGLEYNYQSIAGHWATNLSILDLKIKGFVTTGKIKFEDPQSGDVKYDHSAYGLNISLGKSFIFVEPFAGLGYVSAKNKLIANASLFNGVATQQIANGGVDTNDVYFFAGAAFHLLIAKLGVEISNPYGNNKITARIAFGF